MDIVSIGKVIGAFLFVIGLIGLSAFLVRRLGLEKRLLGQKKGGRLGIEETLYLDPRRRLVLLRRDDRLHLVLLSQGGELVVETGIPADEKHNITREGDTHA